MLKFSPANAKIEALKEVDELKPFLADKRKVYSLDLLSGYSCPFAKECLSKAVSDENGKRTIKDGLHTKFRCFSASQEVQYTNVFNLRKHNFDMLRDDDTFGMTCSIEESMPENLGICRIHVAGDFFNQSYFNAWANVARKNPDRLFYAYTKSLRYWLTDRPNLPRNLVLTASRGGRNDNLISENDLRSTTVVFSEKEAEKLGLKIDHDDSHAARPSLRDQNFALLVHGTQPKGSEAAEALKILKRDKVRHSYSRKVESV